MLRPETRNETVRKTVLQTLTYRCPERHWDLRFRLSREERVAVPPRNQLCEFSRMKMRDSCATILDCNSASLACIVTFMKRPMHSDSAKSMGLLLALLPHSCRR